MQWRIDVPESTSPEQLRTALEAKRDAWIQETPQLGDPKVDELQGRIMRAYNEARADLVKDLAAHVLVKSSSLDETHQNVVRQMNLLIGAAVNIAKALTSGTYVRASLSGHWEPGHNSYLDERLSVAVDQCRPPVAKP